MTDLSIIIVNYRGWQRLAQCLDSLSRIADNRFSFEVLIADNCSNDGMIEKFKESFPQFRFILNTGNNGFANGCNLGAEKSMGSYLLFLNPDTVVSPDALYGLLSEALIRKPYSVVSCRQVRENGTEERPYGKFLSPSNLTGWMRAFSKIALRRSPDSFPQTEDFIYPEWISGSVVMINSEDFKNLGGWDEDFWMYFEDVDLCRRACLKNGEIVLLKKVCVEHNHGGASRINLKVTALTKTEVHISRHLYISKHETGLKAFFMQLFLVTNNLLFGLFPAILGVLLFFVKGLKVSSAIYLQLVGYYLNSIRHRTWLSKRSVNYCKSCIFPKIK